MLVEKPEKHGVHPTYSEVRRERGGNSFVSSLFTAVDINTEFATKLLTILINSIKFIVRVGSSKVSGLVGPGSCLSKSHCTRQ